jgi:hypothetical protein
VPANLIELNCGASDNEIIFGKRNANVFINAGASAFQLNFPKGAGVRIKNEGGANNFENKEDFELINNYYETKNYDVSSIKINVSLKTGATNIKTKFY